MIFLWGPVIIWMALIFYISGIPSLNSGLGIWDFILRKCAHVFEYAVLTGLLIRAIRKSWTNGLVLPIAFWAAGISLLYAISDEFHQSFVPGRGPSSLDVAVDSIGIVLCAYVWIKSVGYFRLKKL